MEFQLLGPLRVGRAGSDIPIGASKIRVLLAALLLDANSVVPTDRLIEVLWGERPPASATASLHNHLRRLRGLLGDEDGKRIRAVAPGFLIRVEPGELDTDRFTDLCAAGRAAGQAGQWAKASTDLAAALSLWRGTPLADLPELFGRDARILQLLEARLQALEARIEADLELGRHCGLIEELRTLAVEHPVREVFHQQLMLALYRADRPAEALGAFRALRHTLVDGLGVEPSPHLRELRRRIQEADPGLAAPARPGPVGPRSQLPAGTRVFTGREQELDRLIGYARQAPEGNAAGMVVISAIDGMAGIGKTTLAVHAAHRVREDFPDGQLFLDLHGHSTGLEPLTAGDALDWFLRSLGVPPQAVPQDLAERAAFYRDRLEGTRTLIVLDNASSTAQIRPLLPDTPGCLVLVTSRRRLVGLDDAHPLTLDVLSEADAVALLHKVAGPGRIPAHQSAILELLALCGYVPLAIRIIGARLRYRSTLRIEDLVSRLRDDNARLDHLQDEDRSLTAVFESSYTALPVAEQRLFRLLGLVPGLNVDAYAAASLAGTDHRTAERLLESLLDHNLLTQHTPERYRFHDLIRVYARTLTDQDPPADREAALDRLFDYYQHTAQMADRRLARYTRPDPDTAMATAIPSAVPDLADWTAAQSWMRAERENLLAVISYTTAHAQPARVVALSCAVAAFLRQEGPWPQAAALLHTASVFAGEGGDRLGEANALHELSRMRGLTGDFPAAASLAERALTIYRQLGSRPGQANAQTDLGRTRRLTVRYAEATDLQNQALAGYRALGDRLGEANALHELGNLAYSVMDIPTVVALQDQALAIFRDLGDRLGEANALSALGQARYRGGDYPAAAVLQEQALVVFRDLGSRHGQAGALVDLGRTREATGQFPAAADLAEQAIEIYRELGSRLGEANARWVLGRLRLTTGELDAAAGSLERAIEIYRKIGSRQGEANAVQDLGRVRHAAGEHPAAAALLESSLDSYRVLGDRQGEAESLNSIAALAADAAEPDQAAGYHRALAGYRRALKIAREIASPLDEAHALEGAARAAEQLGDRSGAVAGLREAVAVYRRIGAPEAAAAEACLAGLEGDPRPEGDARPSPASAD